ncbi:MAG: NfeD family protein [Christensenellales bacterium]|jgi:membrane protein implicated in regulation of membrane protease activity|nr:NfeD family protein [Clostridiales bacterium]
MSPWFWVWLSVVVVTLIIEATTVGFASIWFSIGAFVAMLMSISDKIPWWAQAIVFVVVSLGLLLSLRKISLKLFEKNKKKKGSHNTNLDRYIGKIYEVIQVIDDGKRAMIKINDIDWEIFEPNKEYVIGDHVKVIDFSGSKVVVKKEENIVLK